MTNPTGYNIHFAHSSSESNPFVTTMPKRSNFTEQQADYAYELGKQFLDEYNNTKNESDLINSLEQLQKAYNLGETSAGYELGLAILNYFPEQREEAIKYLEGSLENGDSDAGKVLAELSLGEKNTRKAIEYLEKCTSENAKLRLVDIYLHTPGMTIQQFDKAFVILKRLAVKNPDLETKLAAVLAEKFYAYSGEELLQKQQQVIAIYLNLIKTAEENLIGAEEYKVVEKTGKYKFDLANKVCFASNLSPELKNEWGPQKGVEFLAGINIPHELRKLAVKQLAFIYLEGKYGIPQDKHKAGKYLEAAGFHQPVEELQQHFKVFAETQNYDAITKWAYYKELPLHETRVAAFCHYNTHKNRTGALIQLQKIIDMDNVPPEVKGETYADMGRVTIQIPPDGHHERIEYTYDREYKKAIEYWKKGAELGNDRCKFYLGIAYHTGNGVEKDVKKAKEFWEAAAKNGHAASRDLLAGALPQVSTQGTSRSKEIRDNLSEFAFSDQELEDLAVADKWIGARVMHYIKRNPSVMKDIGLTIGVALAIFPFAIIIGAIAYVIVTSHLFIPYLWGAGIAITISLLACSLLGGGR